MISVSGVRGIVGPAFTPELAVKFGNSFGTYVKSGRVVVGRDTRVSGPMIQNAVMAGLLASGCEVVDLGVCLTPTVQFMVPRLDADGGVVITASHNPAEWNALKFIRPDGIFLSRAQGEELIDIYHQESYERVSWDKMGSVHPMADAIDRHIDAAIRLVDIDVIRKAAPRVVIDCVNGAGSIIAPRLLEKLGCDVVRIHCTPDGMFPRNPEPRPENLHEIAEVVGSVKADIGFALDADGDRVCVIGNDGVPLTEEMTISLASDFILGKTPGPIVANLSTTRRMDDLAAKYGVRIGRSPIGEVNVVEKMVETGAVIGGEGNGGVIYPKMQYARDSLVAMSLILQSLAESGKSILDIAAAFTMYHMEKVKIPCPRDQWPRVEKAMEKLFEGEDVDYSDGFKVNRKSGWIHARMSGTEPVLRVIAEAANEEDLKDMMEKSLHVVRVALDEKKRTGETLF